MAQVAEISVEADGSVRARRIVCAIDCGIAVNPDIIEAQMEGAAVFALSAALKGEITVADGRVQQGTFNDNQVMRIGEMPDFEVHILPSDAAPGVSANPGCRQSRRH